jgi:serine/threonine protein kinase
MERSAILEALEKLGRLHKDGLLPQEEFEEEKAALLGKMRGIRASEGSAGKQGADAFSTGGRSSEASGGGALEHGGDVFATGFAGIREQTNLVAGQVIGGRYRLVRMLGRGGMGDVWLAEDQRLGRAFALKFLVAELVGSSEALSRMHREYEVLEKLTHPHIVRVFDLDQDEASGRWYLRMEYVEGEDLQNKIREAEKTSKRPLFSLEEMGVWLGQLAEALGYMHERGILHRDIKPANLMLTSEKQLKVMDFGIARVLRGTHTTQHTAMMGSMYYAAPELLRGQSATAAADVYSFGVLAYEMLTGKKPMGRFPLPSRVVQGLSVAVDEAVEAMLAMEPSERPASMREVWHKLHQALSGKAPAPKVEVVAPAPKVEVIASAPKIVERVAGERKVWTLGGAEFAMRWIPAGRFLMGAGAEDTEAFEREKPQHEVTLTRGFWMGETPVTQRQYQAIMGVNPSDFKDAGLDFPVECVSWYDAAWFTNKLSALEGLSGCFVGSGEQMKGVGNEGSDYLGYKGWRLPTEAEWEYAARAGTTAPRYGELDKIAWYHGNGGSKTHSVSEKAANPWGLHDMLGNVWEWCYDWFDDSAYQKRGKAVIDPVQAATGNNRVLRGGCWYNHARYVRAASRYYSAPSLRDNYFVGFRLFRSSP